MPANIKNNNVRALDIRLYNDEYWDFMLYKGECSDIPSGMNTECLSAYIDMGNSACTENGKLYSTYSWENAVSNGVLLKDIGFTGVDNGFFTFDKNSISPSAFLKLYMESEYEIPSGDTRFFLSPVSGNTQSYSYGMETVNESGVTYEKLTGGFYQGFFKLNGFDYQTLPSTLDSDWVFEFTLRKQDYDIPEDSVNAKYPENAGTFFYMGTRAENKFAEIYNGEYDNEKSFDELPPCSPLSSKYCEDFFKDYIRNDEEEAIDLGKYEIKTSDEHSADQQGYYEIQTDNKYLFFNHTCTGFTTHNWDEDNEVILEGENREYITNPYLLYNHTCTGYTVKDYEKITVPAGATSASSYNMNTDLKNNAFSLKINDDGSIGYRYTVTDCSGDTGIQTLEENSLSGLVKTGEWVTITVRCSAINGYTDACGNNVPKNRKMKIYVYLNGYLILISKELPIFNFKALNDVATKQEGVPYNISLGGGTQGLMERIWLNYMEEPYGPYELEKNYAGTFIGDFKSFKMYTCDMNIGQIRENYKYEQGLLWLE